MKKNSYEVFDRNPVIAVDFDGTCVTHEYPKIGHDIGAAPVLKRMVEKEGCRLILLTMRSGKELDEAVAWFRDNGIPLWAVNRNPEQSAWTDSPKVYAHLYIDDAALGCPLVENPVPGKRPFVDWVEITHHFWGVPECPATWRVCPPGILKRLPPVPDGFVAWRYMGRNDFGSICGTVCFGNEEEEFQTVFGTVWTTKDRYYHFLAI